MYHKQDDEQTINRHETFDKIYVEVEELHIDYTDC